jgi:hypothetical protein
MSAPSETKIAPLVVDLPLAEVFHSASVLLQGLKKSSHASSSKQYQELLQKTFDMFSSVQERVQGAGVFSSNEELEDVTTASLKYLAVPFYLADMLYLFTGMEGRMQRLQKAKVCMCICMWDKTMRHLCIYIYIYTCLSTEIQRYLDGFLKLCVQFEFVHAEDKAAVELAAAGKAGRVDRSEKIARYKREKALDEKLDYMLKKRAEQKKAENVLDDDNEEEDEVQREFYTVVAKSCVPKAIQHIALSVKEVQMLEMMANRPPPPSNNNNSSSSSSSGGDAKSSSATRKPTIFKITDASQLENLPEHLGRHITLKAVPVAIDGVKNVTSVQNLISHQVNARENLFKQSNPYTMTPEQWAEREIKNGNLPGPKAAPRPTRESRGYVLGSDHRDFEGVKADIEDNGEDDGSEAQLRGEPHNSGENVEEEHDNATYKAREWADWADDNEKGAGARSHTHSIYNINKQSL